MRNYTNRPNAERQAVYDRRYRAKRRRALKWLDDTAGAVGMTRDQLTTSSNAELVAALLRQHRNNG